MKKLLFYWLILLLGPAMINCSSPTYDEPGDPNETDEREHPFLIVKADQFPALRERAKEEPWTSIGADAIRRSDAGFRWGNSNSSNAYALQKYIGAAALAYILEEERAQTHAERVRDAILDHYARLDLNEDRDWGGVVPNLGSFFVAILSLDIVYNALSDEAVQQCEKVIEDQIFSLKRQGSWVTVRLGTHGTWDIYRGIRTEPDDAYYEATMRQITEDGVSPVTIHYAWERIGGGNSRISKSGYMDVLEFTGIDRRYYNNERLQKFQRWLFGSSVNTAKEMAIIGDMLPTQNLYNDMLHRRVVNFDDEAAGYAAWFHEGRPAEGNILTYILPQKALPAPKVPQSQWYPNGGAYFREKADDPTGLHGVLYNIKSQDEWHTHQETNGLALSGLGNRLLVNGGRLGAPTRAAARNNTLTVNGVDHASRLGAGIVQGITSDYLDYACGSAGPALPSYGHFRSLLLIHASENIRPYFLVLDEISGAGGETVKNYFHPANESSVQEILAGHTYTAPIDHYPSSPGTSLGFFFITTPEVVQVEKVPSAVPDRYPDYPDHHRLEASYPVAVQTVTSIATLLFPFRSSEPLPVFERLEAEGVAGGSITHTAGVTDCILNAGDQDEHQYADVRFQGRSVLYRKVAGQLDFFFLREGRSFSQGDFSMTTDDPVSILLRDNIGGLSSLGTQLVLKGPDVETIQFEPAVTELQREPGLLRVELPAGTVKMF